MAEENTNNDLETLRQEILAKLEGLDQGKAIVSNMNEEELRELQTLNAEQTRERIGIILTNQEKNDENKQDSSLTVDEIIPPLNVNEKTDNQTDQNEDWKDRIRAKERETNQELGNNFQEVETDNKTAPLTFKDDKGNTHEFSSENHCRVAGDQTAFDQLAHTAKKLGKDAINFGEFKEHPEYKTRLYLACLKEGLQPVGNVPSPEEIENSPEAKEITKELIKKNRREIFNKLKETRKNLAETQTIWENDPDYQTLTTAYETALNAHESTPSEATQNALNLAEDNMKKNDAYQSYYSAQKSFHNTVIEAKEFYLTHGSEKDAETTTREQREERLKKHLAKYNPKEFFKDENGQPLKNYNEQIKRHQPFYNALKKSR